jgi:transcription elongation factor GreA
MLCNKRAQANFLPECRFNIAKMTQQEQKPPITELLIAEVLLLLCPVIKRTRCFMSVEYMSQEGYDKLVAELRQLETVELPQVREAIAEARDKGDLSENFEYHAAKREQGRLLGRIRFKQRVLENARVIDTSRLGSDSIGLLSKVEMTNLANNSRMTYTIASPHEANLREGKISIKSPIAQALLNKKAGDIVEVRVPAGMLRLRIESICL